MKKFYTLLFSVALVFGANAQNLVTNPSFDTELTGWTSGPTSSYALPTLVPGDGSDGANSVKYVATATTGFYQEVPVVAGHSLKISFWYKATGDDSDARIWSNYRDAADVNIYQVGTSASAVGDPLRTNNEFLPTATVWTKFETTVTSPANVTKLIFAVRAYNGGTVSFDQFSVEDLTLGVNQNQIDGLKIYPNPVTNGTFFINTSADSTKEVVVYDVLGKQVIKTSTTNAVNVSNLKGGVYIVKITEDGNTATRKLVIK